MNRSAAKAEPTINGFEGHYKPVWAAKFRTVKVKGRTAYFRTPEAAECAAWRVLYATEQRVMSRDGETIYAARSAADRLFQSKGERVGGGA